MKKIRFIAAAAALLMAMTSCVMADENSPEYKDYVKKMNENHISTGKAGVATFVYTVTDEKGHEYTVISTYDGVTALHSVECKRCAELKRKEAETDPFSIY